MPVILVEARGRTALITLNRPEALNSLNAELFQGLAQAFAQVRDDPQVWTVVVTGAGDKSFCSGADLKWMSQIQQEALKAGKPVNRERPRVDPLRDFGVWKPVIAAVNGYCIAGGLELALACDIRIAAEHASFGLAEVTRGIIPGAGGTQRLPRLAPFGAALELLMTGDRVGAAEAYRLGLVNRVVPLAELLPTALALAEKINGNGPLAVRAVKEAAYRGTSLPLGDGLRVETALWWATQQTEDAKEGPKAFAEKRKPEFKGR